MSVNYPSPKIDSWIWGNELIVWGFAPGQQYTFKILEPKPGRNGCLSLQYHNQKSETWFVLRGSVWALIVADGQVCTRIMRPGDIQNINPGMIHRLTGISSDARIVEPSTPDAHAADKSIVKDVIRLHCVHGRPVQAPRNATETKLVDQAIQLTEQALQAIDSGREPIESNPEYLIGRGGFSV